jgi:hypothetical protein
MQFTPQEQGAELDRRTLSLAGAPSWIRSGIEVYSHGNTLTAHDWIQLVQSAGDYVFRGIFPNHPYREEALLSLRDACNALLEFESSAMDEDRAGTLVEELKLKVVEALCKIESVVPTTELAVMLHILLHVADCTYKWNAVRNWWSFFGERCVLYMISRDITWLVIISRNITWYHVGIYNITQYHVFFLISGAWVTSSGSFTTGTLLPKTSRQDTCGKWCSSTSLPAS